MAAGAQCPMTGEKSLCPDSRLRHKHKSRLNKFVSLCLRRKGADIHWGGVDTPIVHYLDQPML